MTVVDPTSLAGELGDLDSAELGLLQQLAAAPARHSSETLGLEPGSVLGEHLTLERHLGAGAMGTVFLAHDSRLQRRVAVKIHFGTGDREVAKAEREARALARVSHPNVLAVHEVGRIGPRLFVATEYVEGETAAQWMERDHGWRRVVEVYAAAGEGLAAAHDAGLVHRDFKPANVLIGRDGRVRVADFGLARAIGEGSSSASPAPLDLATSDSGDPTRPEQLSMTRAFAGTPAYMAPEQLDGQPSPRADQFSFCVALAESLTGARPYGERLANTASPEDFSLARGPRARPPRRLAKLLRKGAALDPAARYPSMAELVAELRRLSSPRYGLALIGGLAIASLGLGAAWWSTGHDDAQLCLVGADERVAEVWSSARADALAEAFAEAHPSAGPGAWAPLPARLDTYLAAWARAREDSCRATHVAGTQSQRALEQSMACFERRLGELDASLRALARVEGSAVGEAWQAIPERGELDPCQDPSQLAAWAERPAATPDAAASLAYARTLQLLGKRELARETLAALTAQAERSHDEPTRIRAELLRAHALHDSGETELAEELAEDMYWAARRTGLEAEEQRAALILAAIEILRRREPAAARVWLRASRHLRGTSELRHEAIWLDALILQEQGKPEAAIELLVAALDQLDEHEGDDRLLLLDALNTAYDINGQPQEALETIDSALALADSLSGDNSSAIWPLLSNRGLMLDRLARHEESIVAHGQAIALAERLYGPEFVDARGLRLNLALALCNQGDYEAALELLPTILTATEAKLGPQHPDVALVLEVRGYALGELGRVEAALDDFHAAIAIARASLDPSHPDVPRYLQHVARASRLLGRHEAEAEAALAAVRGYEAAGETDRAQTRVARFEAARVSLELERWDIGFELADAAVDPSDPSEHLRAVWELAAAHLEGSPPVAARARSLAAALADAAGTGGHTELRREIDARVGPPR